MNSKILSLTCAAGLGLTFAGSVFAQAASETKLEFPQASPASTVKQRIGLTDFEVNYSRPSKKGREVYGSVVPFGKMWRTGANMATKVTVSTPVKVGGKEVPAGTYVLLTIPNKNEWTVILNKNTEQQGPYKYEESGDVARVTVKPEALAEAVETFTIGFNDIKESSGVMHLCWDKTTVPVKVEVDFVQKLLKQIGETMASDAKEKPYFQAAAFYSQHDHELAKAKEWIDKALAEKETYWMVFVKAQILNKLGDKAGALAASNRSTELATKGNDDAYIKLNKDFVAGLK